nr:aminotransferase class IV [uncultured Halomonas sp.]
MMSPALPDNQQVPFDDRGFAYGDGVFETVLLRAGAPVLWDYHTARLKRGCQRLGIPAPCQTSLDATWQGAPTAALEVLKLVITRGSGGRGYAEPDIVSPRLLSRRTPFQPLVSRWQQGVTVRLCNLRLGHQPCLAGIKHLNRLENVLARREWSDTSIAEGLLAVCIQHECDHLNGKLFVDYLSNLKRDRIRKKLEKIHKAQANA